MTDDDTIHNEGGLNKSPSPYFKTKKNKPLMRIGGDKAKLVVSDLNEKKLEEIRSLAREILPLSLIASKLGVNPNTFYSWCNKEPNLRLALVLGEYDKWMKEKKTYEKILDASLTGEFIEIKSPAGEVINKKTVTPFDVQLAGARWKEFKKTFKTYSYTARLEKSLDKYIENEDSKGTEEDWLSNLRKHIVEQLDQKTGVKDRPKGDLTFRPEHYHISLQEKEKEKEK